MVMSGRSVNLTTLFLGRLRPPKQLISTQCPNFRQLLTNALLESVEGGNDRRKDFMSDFHKCTWPGVEPSTFDFSVRRDADCATRPGSADDGNGN